MKLTFAPTRSDVILSLFRKGDILTINGADIDCSEVTPESPLLREDAGSDWLASDVTRVGNDLHLTLVLPHGANAPPETLFPAAMEVHTDGPVALPPHDCAPEEVPDTEITANLPD